MFYGEKMYYIIVANGRRLMVVRERMPGGNANRDDNLFSRSKAASTGGLLRQKIDV